MQPETAWLPEVLSFESSRPIDDLRHDFTMLLSDRLGSRVGIMSRSSGSDVAKRMGELPPESFLRILIAPESIRRLLWPETHTAAEIARFFQRAVEAERSCSGLSFDLDSAGWTAMGDKWTGRPMGYTQAALDDFPIIVLGDPSARHPSAVAEAGATTGNDELPPGELADVLQSLEEVRRRLLKTDASIWRFARDLNVTLVLRGGAGNAGFRSSSPERVVGRSILWNPHVPEVTEADLAEALVHEAIHTVLDMADALISRVTPPGQRWVTSPDLYDGVSRTTSPWTGRPLDVPTFVHGFLVWYGLLSFWSMALLSGSFDSKVSQQRMIRAGAPFMNRTALQPLEPFGDSIRPDIRETLKLLQARVSDEFSSVLPRGAVAR